MNKKQTILGLTAYPNTDKQYIVDINEYEDKKYCVVTRYGRRNNVGNHNIEKDDLCYEEAVEIHDKIVNKKLKKGYEIEKQHESAR